MWQQIWTTIVSEFSDLPDVESVTRITVRMLVAGFLGGLLGYERERRGKNAGVRTHMLVAVGAATFVLVSQQNGASPDSITRVFQGVVQGVGFLGAGAIIIGTAGDRNTGLTTAASIWATAGIGMTAGLGMEATAVLATVIILFILTVVPKILRPIRAKSEGRDTP